MRKRIVSVILIICLLVLLLYGGQKQAGSNSSGGLFNRKETLVLWYTDEGISNYIESTAYEYYKNTGIKVVTQLVSGLEYLEKISEASLGKDGPDMFIVNSDSLEKAYLAGLTSPIRDINGVINNEHYSQSALNAVTYKDKLLGYPFYYETSVFLYNHTYVADYAKKKLEEEADAAEGEAAQAALDAAGEAALSEQEAIEAANMEPVNIEAADEIKTEGAVVENAIPHTIEDILSFASGYDAPEQVEFVFKWDVSDIFYNYFIVGNYITVGGTAGDNKNEINIYNEEAMKCMMVYQGLNQFFSIDTKEVTYDSILKEFAEGKTVFTVATTDAIALLEEEKAAGNFPYEYGITTLPAINDELETKSLSVTNALVVNGYSNKKQLTNDFARFLVYDKGEGLYERSGKICSRQDAKYKNQAINSALKVYQSSTSLPKMLETGNFWAQLEVAFANIWQGADVNTELKSLSEQIMTQVTGSKFTEEPLPTPEIQEDQIQ